MPSLIDVITKVLTLHSNLHCTGSTCTHSFDVISTVMITSSRDVRVSVKLMLLIGVINYIQIKSYPQIVKSSAAQKATSSTCQQEADRETANVTWMIIAIVLLVVAILLAITSIALGTILCLTRKSVKSVPAPKLTPHQGQSKIIKMSVQKKQYDVWKNQQLYMSIQT